MEDDIDTTDIDIDAATDTTERPATAAPVVIDYLAEVFDPVTRLAAVDRIHRTARDGRFGTLALISNPDETGRCRVTHVRFPSGEEPTLEAAIRSGLFD